MRKILACACGDHRFTVRLHRDEQVGLVTCSQAGHHSLLLDSRDHWHDVIQTARPREAKCRCGGRAFEVELEYELREDKSIRSVEVLLRCVACGSERVGVTFEIDYEPTEVLIKKPLDPCPEPWLKARQKEASALWLPSDVSEVLAYVGELRDTRCYLARSQEGPRRLVPAKVLAAIADETPFDVFFSMRDVEFPSELRDCWKRLPLIHLASPIHMHYRSGQGTLYFLHWSEEYLVDGGIVPQEESLLALARRLRAWLATRFTSKRGAQTFDNPSEYERLKTGW